MMGFQCMECKCDSSTFDDVLGENVCDDCGLVYLTNPFEETVKWWPKQLGDFDASKHSNDSDGSLGSYIMREDIRNNKDRSLRNSNIRSQSKTTSDRHMFAIADNILWKYNVKRIYRDRVRSYYKALQSNRILGGLSIETRAAGLTYFILKEAKISVRLKQHSKVTHVSISQIAKCAKKIAKFHRKSYIFSLATPIEDALNLMEKLDVAIEFREPVLKLVEYIHRKYEYCCVQYTHNTLGAIFWMVGRMIDIPLSQVRICKKTGGSEIGLRQSTHKICDMIGMNRNKISRYDVDNIVNGIRYG